MPNVVEVMLVIAPESITVLPVGLIVTDDSEPVGLMSIVWSSVVKLMFPGKLVSLPASPNATVPVLELSVKSPTGRIVACAPGCIDTELCGLISTSPDPVGLISTFSSNG